MIVTAPLSAASHQNLPHKVRAWNDDDLDGLGRWAEARPVLEDLRARTTGDADVGAALRAQLTGEPRAPDSSGTAPRRVSDP